MISRRGFLGSILALGAAPAIVRADALMRIVPRDVGVFTISDADLMMNVDDFVARYLVPAGQALAETMDMRIAKLYGNHHRWSLQ